MKVELYDALNAARDGQGSQLMNFATNVCEKMTSLVEERHGTNLMIDTVAASREAMAAAPKDRNHIRSRVAGRISPQQVQQHPWDMSPEYLALWSAKRLLSETQAFGIVLDVCANFKKATGASDEEVYALWQKVTA